MKELREVRNIRIRPADNGYILEISEFSDGSGPDVTIHNELADVLATIKEALE